MSYVSKRKTQAKGFVALCLGTFLAIAIPSLFPVNAQNLRPEMVAAQVYKSLTEFPLENQHFSQETGKPATDHSLVSRIIRYHQYIKNRPLEYRLDWKLTLADYLGVNETITPSNYPGNATLKNNPLESDRAAISNLDRTQRNQLVDTLVNIYNPQSASVSNSESSPSQSTVNNSRDRQQIPQRGNANLLK